MKRGGNGVYMQIRRCLFKGAGSKAVMGITIDSA